jgi:hypothetical protein
VTVEASYTCLAQSAEVLPRQDMSELLKTVREQKTDDFDEAGEGLTDLRTRMAASLGEALSGWEPGGSARP